MFCQPTFRQVFGASLLGLAAVLALLFWQVVGSTRQTLEDGADRLREALSSRISERVAAFLAQGPEAARQVQLAFNRGLVNPHDRDALTAVLLPPLLANPDLGEITFTYGRRRGYDAEGMIILAEEPRGQISVIRSPGADGSERFLSRRVWQEGGVFVAEWREIGPAESPTEWPPAQEKERGVPDPTMHPTFLTPASETFFGRLLWSDLHWSQLDAARQQNQQRVEVSVQQVMTDGAAKFAGVLRVGLLARQLDQAVQLDGAAGQEDPHLVFLCDPQGRLVTRGNPGDEFIESGDDLRVSSRGLPPVVTSALAMPELRQSAETGQPKAAEIRTPGGDFFATFQPLPPGQTQDWVVVVVGAKSFYLGPLKAVRDRLLLVSGGIIAGLMLLGSLVLRSVRRAQEQITREAAKMNAFDFKPAPVDAPIRDVASVLESLERAKTAMRAMSKYVPVGLVRLLYHEGSEPVVGGAPREISLMFTDIAGFTGITEKLPVASLAGALERYLDLLAGIIQHETGGTIDKYIGDAIMVFWNAPLPVEDHAVMACRAALRCREAGRALARTPAWEGLPPFETRFGLHCGTALVGHFGATDRLNYTAIGDAVNLASRLEGLNKLYGTSIIASESVVVAVGGAFVFRLLDKVAVKGKEQAVLIYELLGPQGTERGRAVELYEQAFNLYLGGAFGPASSLLAGAEDPASLALLERCRKFLENPPTAGWSGTHLPAEK